MKLSQRIFSGASAFVLAITQSLHAQELAPIRIDQNIVYSHAGGAELKLDIAWPRESAGKGPLPALVYFHGGGWQAGKRQDAYGTIQFLAEQGIVAITVSYRFAPEFKWPYQIYDAKTAVRYVRAHAKELNIDPDRIAAAGDSAGAYLAAMLGMTKPADGFEGDGEWKEVSSEVRAVVSYYTASDLTRLKSKEAEKPKTEAEIKAKAEADAATFRYYHKTLEQVIADWSGTTDPLDPVWARISLLKYVSAGDAPILILQGDKDTVVNPEHAFKLDRALTAVNVPHELVIIEGGGHGFYGPQLELSRRKMAEFLATWLKATP